jgi:hypothetical protein
LKKILLFEAKFCRESVGDGKLSRHVRERSHYSNVRIIVSSLLSLFELFFCVIWVCVVFEVKRQGYSFALNHPSLVKNSHPLRHKLGVGVWSNVSIRVCSRPILVILHAPLIPRIVLVLRRIVLLVSLPYRR